MGLQPLIPKKKFTLRKCTKCEIVQGEENFIKTNSLFYDGYLPICNNCINEWLAQFDYNWAQIDKICQWIDIPFVPAEWEKIKSINTLNEAFPKYAEIFNSELQGLIRIY